MWLDIPTHYNSEYIVLQVNPTPPVRYTWVASIGDIDHDGRLAGIELILGSADDLAIDPIKRQFLVYDNISVDDSGYMYLYLRRPEQSSSWSSGFTVTSQIGLTSEGYISTICIPRTDLEPRRICKL